VLGLPTILCTAAALILRLNLAAIQLVNYLAAPLQLLLIIPFARLGEPRVHAAPQPLTISGGLKLLAAGALKAMIVLCSAIVHAAIGWALAGPPFIYLVYLVLKPLMVKAARNIRRARIAARCGALLDRAIGLNRLSAHDADRLHVLAGGNRNIATHFPIALTRANDRILSRLELNNAA
jgi:hypothetical protein